MFGKLDGFRACRPMSAWLVLALYASPLPAQIRFENISLEEGLTQSTVVCVLQDSRGFMWFGTHNGLHRYDGHQLVDFRHSPDRPESIANDVITAICEDREGYLWIGTRDGLSKLVQPDIPGGRFLNFGKDGDTALPHTLINALTTDRQGYLWIGTRAGLSRMEAATGRLSPIPAEREPEYAWTGLDRRPITCILEDSHGELWVGTDGWGLFRLNEARLPHTVYHGMNFHQALRYTPEAISAVKEIKGKREPLASVSRPGNSEDIGQPFYMEEPGAVLIIAMGEANDRVYDFGAILDAQGQPVWAMTSAAARHAGGAGKNRLQMEVTTLPAGDYRLHYTSDDSHAYGSWNESPPDEPEWWGMAVFVLGSEEKGRLASLLPGYEHRSNIESNRISALAEDGNGDIWIGTVDRGLRRWQRQQDVFTPIRNHRPVAGRRYSAGFMDQVDDIMAKGPPLMQLAGTGDNTDHNATLDLARATKVLVVSGGSAIEGEVLDGASLERDGRQIWAMDFAASAHAGGYLVNRLQCALLELEPGRHTLRYRTDRYYSPGNWGGGGPDREELWGVRLFVLDDATATALADKMPAFEERAAIPSRAISALAHDPRGHIWIGTLGGGLGAVDLADEAFAWFRHDAGRPDSPSSDIIYNLAVDTSGILWAGTELGGVSIMDPHKHRFDRFGYNPGVTPTLAAEQVFAFLDDGEDHLFIGTDRGLSLLHLIKNAYLPARGDHPLIKTLADARITCFLRDRHGDVWIGTGRKGLLRTMGTSPTQPALQRMGTFRHYTQRQTENLASNNITVLLEDEADFVWIGTMRGLYRYDNEHFERFLTSPERQWTFRDVQIRSLLLDRRQRMWVGSAGGLHLLDRDTGAATTYANRPGDKTSLSHNIVSALYEGERGIWVGTYGGGLNLFDPATGRCRRYTEADGLPNNVIYGILPDGEDGLWMSSNKGLSRLDPATGHFRNYDAGDGLQSNEFNSGAFLQLADGKMVFGGVKGFNIFDPTTVAKARPAPPIAITAVKTFGRNVWFERPLALIQEIELDHDQDFLSFEFVALDFSNPEHNSYAHMLEGYNDTWVPNGNRRFASYTNLDPGAYTFRVKGANDDGTWNETGASIRIRIRPPFWQTWWFRLLAVTLAVAGVVWVYRYRVRQLQREKRLKEIFAERLIYAQEAERRRIATELHDSLGQNLLVINNEIQHRAQTVPDENEREHLNELASLTLDAINEVRDIAYDLHPHQLERLGLKRAVESVINRVAVATECDLELHNAEIDGLFTRDMEINFFRIIQEAVNNILKHAEASHASIHITRNQKCVDVRIRDNGIGFETGKNTGAGGIGLTGLAERARLLGGQLKISSEPGAGTSLSLVIPLAGPNEVHPARPERADGPYPETSPPWTHG